ncbi:MAG: hypothetical protein ABSH35_29675 [Isosphaeraceae bacterium]|jgi:hypothetical protein
MIGPGPVPIADRPPHEFALADSNDELLRSPRPVRLLKGSAPGFEVPGLQFFADQPAALARASKIPVS